MTTDKTIEISGNFLKECYSFTWNIDNFNLMPFFQEHPIYGPNFVLGKQAESTWQLMMIKVKDEGIKKLGFRLFKTEDNDLWDICEYTVFLKSKEGKTCIKSIDRVTVGSEDDEEYVYCETRQDEAKEASKENFPETEDSHTKVSDQEDLKIELETKESQDYLDSIFDLKDLIVVCDITYVYLVQAFATKRQEPQEICVAHDLKQLYKSQKFSDVILRAGKLEFHAHSNILCSRSFSFDRLLQEKEGHLGQQKELLLDVPESVAEMMLLYMYTGELPVDVDIEDYYKLHKAARKYGINNLAEMCSKVLKLKSKSDPICNDCHEDEVIRISSVDDEINKVVEMSDSYSYKSLGV